MDVWKHLTLNYLFDENKKSFQSQVLITQRRQRLRKYNLYFCFFSMRICSKPISESRLAKYIIVFTPGWLKVPILEMRSISERWLLYEPQHYCPGIDCFISAEIKNIINFIRISSRIAGCSLFRKYQNCQASSLTYYWLRATQNVGKNSVSVFDRSIFYEKHELWAHTSYTFSQ